MGVQGVRRPGEELGGYVLLRSLGAGGMGTVYEALDADQRRVAVKVLHPHIGADPHARDRLRREVATLHRVRHVGVARVLDAEVDSDEAFVVTELVEGRTLDEVVRTAGPLEGHELAELGRGLAEALTAIHAAGVLHRDVKPANVLLTEDGPVLIDFGIAQLAEEAERVTQTGLVSGTPGYLDPRLVAGAAPSPASDWWGWAAVLAFAATGRPPFGRGAVDVTLARVARGEADLAGLPSDLRPAFAAALNPDPTARLPHADLLAALSGDVAVTARLRPPSYPPRPATTAVPPAGQGGTSVVPRHPAVPIRYGLPVGGPPGPAPGWGPAVAPRPAIPPGPGPAAWPPPPRSIPRPGVLFGLWALAAGWASWRPGAVAVVAVCAMAAAAGVGAATSATRRRRARVGARRGDLALAIVGGPWHLVRGLLATLPSALFGAAVAAVVGVLAWLGATGGAGAWPADSPEAQGAVAALTVGTGLVAAWHGPGSALRREGARELLGAVLPRRADRPVMVLAALAGAVVLASVLVGALVPDLWPLR